MGKPATQATKPEAAKATEQVTQQVTEQATSATSEQAGVQSATEAAAEEAAATAAAVAPKSNLYTVASPIKHDGKDYAEGDQLRLPEATAHRLAGYLKA